jgi:hypothetical protein
VPPGEPYVDENRPRPWTRQPLAGPEETRVGRAFRNLTARRDGALADDWDVGPGRVSGRVGLFLRSTERYPVPAAL